MSTAPVYVAEYAKTGRSTCKNRDCKKNIAAQSARLGRRTANPFSDDDTDGMVAWYHPDCLFRTLENARIHNRCAATDIKGLEELEDDDVALIAVLAEDHEEFMNQGGKKGKAKASPVKTKSKAKPKPKSKVVKKRARESDSESSADSESDDDEDDDEYVPTLGISNSNSRATRSNKNNNNNNSATWEYSDDDGNWAVYGDKDAAILEAQYTTLATGARSKVKTFKTGDFSFNFPGTPDAHLVDFSSMTQLNVGTNMTRRMQRTGGEGASSSPVAKKTKPAAKKARVGSSASSSSAASSSTNTKHKASSKRSKAGSASFTIFTRMTRALVNDNSHVGGMAIVQEALDQAMATGDGREDCFRIIKLALPRRDIDKRTYNMKKKRVVSVLAEVTGQTEADAQTALDETGDPGDCAVRLLDMAEEDGESLDMGADGDDGGLTLQFVDEWLDDLHNSSGGDQLVKLVKKILKRGCREDARWVMRLVNKDLMTHTGLQVVLKTLNPKAYTGYRNRADLRFIFDRYFESDGDDDDDMDVDDDDDYEEESEKTNGKGKAKAKGNGAKTGAILSRATSLGMAVLVPIKPMLAAPVKKDFVKTVKKKENAGGMMVEIKYDGERVQIHKDGDTFKFFSRSLRPVVPNKVKLFEEHIPLACPHGDSMVLDAEVLLVDKTTRLPLPFGTLGVNKRDGFQNATVCLFVFDILYFNGKSLLDTPLLERRRILEENITPVENHVRLSEVAMVEGSQDSNIVKQSTRKLDLLMARCLEESLEGLIIKAVTGIYKPGARHWQKVKRDYLESKGEHSMADSVDLVVLGASFGSGKMGGKLSVYLMGVHCKDTNTWKTVCKVGNGFTDAQVATMDAKFRKSMVQLTDRRTLQGMPKWAKNGGLDMHSMHTPAFVTVDPTKSLVWEVTGAEFSKSKKHTANGISIRFPRITRQRHDKEPNDATSLSELADHFEASKGSVAESNAAAITGENFDPDDVPQMTESYFGEGGPGFSP